MRRDVNSGSGASSGEWPGALQPLVAGFLVVASPETDTAGNVGLALCGAPKPGEGSLQRTHRIGILRPENVQARRRVAILCEFKNQG